MSLRVKCVDQPSQILKYICLVSLVAGSFTPATGQTASSYQTQTIYLQGSGYVKDGTRYSRGFFSSNLKRELEVSPDAMLEYHRYRTKKVIASGIMAASIALLVAAVVTDNPYTQQDLTTGSSIVLLVSVPFTGAAYNNLSKSVWIRNGDVLK